MTFFRYMIIIIFIINLLLLQSCEKQEIIAPAIDEPSNPSNLKVIWQKPLGLNDTLLHLSTGPIVHNDKIVIGAGGGNREILQFRNKVGGDFLFLWDDWVRPSFFNFIQPKRILNGNVFANSSTQAYLVDFNSGQTLWHSSVEYGDVETNVVWGNAYHGVKEKSNLTHDFSFLTEIDGQTGQRDTLLTIVKQNSYETSIQPASGWINEKGDSLLIFLVRKLDFGGTLDEALDAYAYNMTADSIEWRLTDFDPEGSSKVGPPLIEDNLIFFAGQRTFYCLNAKDGSLVWKRRFEDDTGVFTEDLFSSAFIKIDDKLIISPSNENTYCFDAYTGEEIWKETDSASSPQNMVHYDGVVYCASRGRGRLFAFDVETGKHFWREHPPNHALDDRASFTNRIDLDPETGYIYLDDGFFVMCIEPYER
ncbi:MAG: PQQ-binding-like beta-propeller repeat protein [Bacteroidota bacterium]